MKQIDAKALLSMMTDDNLELLDVRESWEYDYCHIKGAKLMPMATVADSLDLLDLNKHYVVICHHGIRSLKVAYYLKSCGFKTINLIGGVDAWAQIVDKKMPRY